MNNMSLAFKNAMEKSGKKELTQGMLEQFLEIGIQDKDAEMERAARKEKSYTNRKHK